MQSTLHCQECGSEVSRDAMGPDGMVACPKCGSRVDVPVAGVLGPGSVVGGFRLERRLGQGAMGVVFLATQKAMNRKVALKILPSEITADPHLVHRFLREVQMLAKVDHPNIVTAFDAGQDKGAYYLAMTYVDGEDLEKRLKRDGKLPEREALAIIRKVAEALQYAWEEHRILHNDVKPGNIIIDSRGNVKLMDLGLSKTVLEDTGMSMTGKTFGTPNYMSPEQAQGSKNLDTRSDQYALGATLYRFVTGVLPHSGTSVVELLTKKLFQPIPPARTHNPALSDQCEHFLEVLMARDPANRYADWKDLLADLDLVARGEHPTARRPVAGESAIGLEFTSPQPLAPPKTLVMKIPRATETPAPSVMSETQHIEPEDEPVPPRSRVLAICGLAVLLAAAAWYLTSHRTSPAGVEPVAEETGAVDAPVIESAAQPAPSPEPEPVAAAAADAPPAWVDTFDGAGGAFKAEHWQLLSAPVIQDGFAVLTGPTMEWGAEGLLGTQKEKIPLTIKGGVEARVVLSRSEILATDKSFENAGYFDVVLSPDASRTAYVSDTPLAVIRIQCMNAGGYAYQVGVKKGKARPNMDPLWLEKTTALPEAATSVPLEIALVVLPQNVHITLSQGGKILHRRLHWVDFPAPLAAQGVVPQCYVANQGKGRVRIALDDFSIRPVDTTYLLEASR